MNRQKYPSFISFTHERGTPTPLSNPSAPPSLRHPHVALISLPMSIIIVVNGHASAVGFLFAINHDYVLMHNDKGVLYISQRWILHYHC